MFVVPIIFFSIFAMIFGRGIGSGKTAPVKVLFVNQDKTEVADTVIEDLMKESGLNNVIEKVVEDSADAEMVSVNHEVAKAALQEGQATLAIVLPRHFGDAMRDGSLPSIEIFADTSDQIATQVVSALVRQAVLTEQSQLAAEKARRPTPGGPTIVNKPELEVSRSAHEITDMITVRDVLATEKSNPKISMYAAGIAVMFLLFSASGAGGTLLEEQEAGTLERLLSSQLSVTQLLAGKWIFITLCGTLQLLVMFIWGQIVFQVDLVGHLDGFALMALATAAAAASFALLLATLCRSRSQLNGISVILILTMSALGGSMVPRYIMSEELQRYGLLTFNAWALDGFDKVFWRELPLIELQPQLMVLLFSALVMAIASRVFARRWEA
jgi:ABC-2 type transport system permease protein